VGAHRHGGVSPALGEPWGKSSERQGIPTDVAATFPGVVAFRTVPLRGDRTEFDWRTGPPGFEPGFEAPEAPVISKLYYGPSRAHQRWPLP
jgi:hypothetical protein